MSTQKSRSRKPARASGSIRAAVLKAARRLYFEHGPEGVSARKIASEVGCSPTALYLHFRSVADLLEDIRMEGHSLLAARLRETPPSLDAVERLRAMGRAYFHFGREQPAFYALMFSIRPAEMPSRDTVQREMQTLLVVRDAVVAGMEAGTLRRGDATVIANALWAAVHGVTSLAVSGLLLQTAGGHDEAVLETVLSSGLEALRP